MAEIFLIMLVMSVLFFLLLFIKSSFIDRLKIKFCVICATVSLTWLTLLILYKLNIFNNQIILAILIGQTTLAIYYILEKNKRLRFFRLPLLLSLTIIAYSLIEVPGDILKAASLILIFWLLFALPYNFSSLKLSRSFLKKMVECCKRW